MSPTNRRLKRPSTTLREWVSLILQLAQIVAIAVGGWWAYSKFIQTEAPAQKQNFSTDQKMEWLPSPNDSACYGILSVTFENISRSDVTIRKVVQRAWLLPLPPYDRAISYINPDSLAVGPASDSISYTTGPFVQEYPPEARVRYDLAWTLRRKPGIALFRVDLFANATDKEPIDWVYDWDEICGDSGPAEVKPGLRRPAK
ncbi:MAG TPA: hypothetical protein VGO33_03935 [Gemmatimonadaceae bacterium]|nr:hypothetical protein [Gemmatimonadaceae bacterium]